ncbi:5-methyltetrahydropteroyltriglutamate--homocysteine S-methyltransferase [Alteribacillus sp. HJP-4]|uniref:5-methyltetrahydropteroyltriglutamate-- homocysteine S-methyltransferase n=1 Tax=Alteribacillus sp. HJP-4 TaxID=2775394 RepID=UPI0035CD1F58
MALETNRPPYRADHVGSLLRPQRLKEARADWKAANISDKELRKVEDEEISRIVEEQKNAGLRAVTDGEFRRGWWHFDFFEGLDGVKGYNTESGIQFQQQQTKSRAVKVNGTLDFTSHPMLEHFTYLQKTAGDYTAKMTIPSPSMLHFRGDIDEDIYPDKKLFFADLASTYKKAIEAFYESGCRYLQLDDTSWAYFCSEEQLSKIKERGEDPEELKSWYVSTINEAVADRPKDMKITMHICRGNFRSTWISSGGYEPVAEILFEKLQVDGFFLEYDSDRAGGFEPLRFVNRSDLQIVLGLVTSKFGQLEKKEDIIKRIDEASRYVDINQLCLSPQCGFASTEEGNLLNEKEQFSKLRHVVDISNHVWGEALPMD